VSVLRWVAVPLSVVAGYFLAFFLFLQLSLSCLHLGARPEGLCSDWWYENHAWIAAAVFGAAIFPGAFLLPVVLAPRFKRIVGVAALAVIVVYTFVEFDAWVWSIAIPIVSTLAAAWWLRDRHFVWRTEDITATILRDDELPKRGQFLNLDQRLRSGESGWTNMKIDIPEHWTVRSVAADRGCVTLTLLDGSRFRLHRENVGILSFAILDGVEDKSDLELEALWTKLASAPRLPNSSVGSHES
jgi:hypothetical protein